MKHKTFDTVLFQQNPPRKRCQMRILPKKCLTDNDHDSIPRLQKNSSPQAPLPRWTKIKMERFVAMSSPSSFCDFSHRWPSKNLRQLFLLVNSLARCSHSRSLTSLLRTNKLFWGDNLLTKIKYYMHALLKVEPPLPHILAFLCFWAAWFNMEKLGQYFWAPKRIENDPNLRNLVAHLRWW